MGSICYIFRTQFLLLWFNRKGAKMLAKYLAVSGNYFMLAVANIGISVNIL